MGLDTFETEGPRTWTEDKDRQNDLNGETVSDFELEWDRPLHKAAQDDEFMAERIREADSLEEICDMFMWLEHTVVSRVAELVDNDELEVDQVPTVTHPVYNDKGLEWHIEQRNKHDPLSSSSSRSSSSSSSSSDDSNTGGALDAYRS